MDKKMNKYNLLDDSEGSLIKGTVLIVDDDPVMLDLLDVYITEMNVTVIKAKDGVEALEKIYTQEPDIILTDLAMPRMNGIELVKKLKQNSTTALIPIIVITALTERDIALEALELGVDEFITKPFDKIILRARLKSIFKTKKLQEELINRTVESEKVKLFSEIVMTVFHYVRNTIQPLAIASSRYARSNSDENMNLLFETGHECVDKIYAILNTLHECEQKGLINVKTFSRGVNMLDLEKEINKKLKRYIKIK
jgi:DNA-binding response OmpR family regulator